MTSTAQNPSTTNPTREHAHDDTGGCGCGAGGCGGVCGPSPASVDQQVAPSEPVDVHVYADIVCPWCYIGKRRLDTAVRAFAERGGQVRVRYMPFQLDPDAPLEACELMPTLVEKFGGEQQATQTTSHIAEIAATEGIEIDFDGALAANTLAAHRLLRLAGDHDLRVQAELMDRLMAAHFVDGLDVGADEVLQRLCDELGLKVDVEEYLSSEDGIAAVTEQQDAARAAGITSVPTYVFAARWGISGAQEVSTLLMVLQQVAAQADAQPGAGGGGCCGGGCCGG
ncbi:DsbA family protein [Blastococcus sp. Marseille-P5729]|uniref:DsbA family oxidoreductase n=1 Tax=Blastococcus sp. Marseille-P5729 TaxID=2086582 RepID=UPI00131D26BB|nr:DsbA family oxidoreductase [Blastococcus sp. Marseille-P5729]